MVGLADVFQEIFERVVTVTREAADPGLSSVGKDRLAPEQFEALLQEVLDAALQAVRGIRSGALVPDPTSCAYRGGCAHPTICRCM